MGSLLPDQENVDRQKTGPAKLADKGRLSDRWNPGSETPQDSDNSPHHIVKTSLIPVESENRRRRMRGGESFVLTPHFCGSDATDYARTRDFMDDGIIILAKSTRVDGLSPETRGYRKEHPTFPEQSTADQFFHERQLEAYRELGFKIGTDMINQARLKDLIATVRP